MTEQETFVTRLRRYRQRNRLTLDDIARQTNVKVELLVALEANDLSRWPRGIYARAWIRAYASAVGLDPADTVNDFCRLFAQGDRRMKGTIREIAAIVASPSEYQDDIPHPDRRHDPGAESAPPPAAEEWHPPLQYGIRLVKARLASVVLPNGRRTART